MELLLPDQPMQRSQSSLAELDDGTRFADAKEDGFRCEILVNEHGGIQAMSRHNKPLAVCPQLIEKVKAIGLPPNTQIDSEWMRMREVWVNLGLPEVLYMHDILVFGGKDLRDVPCWDRRQMLLDLLKFQIKPKRLGKNVVAFVYEWENENSIRVPDMCERGFVDFFEEQKKIPWVEGVVIKNKESESYASLVKAKKVAHWQKVRFRAGDAGTQAINY